MKKIISLVILISTLISCAKERNCSKFKTGEFRYLKKDMTSKILRTNSFQIETNPNDKVAIKTIVEWKSDCEYVLTYNEIINYPRDVSEIIGKKIFCKIIETNGNRFKVHAKSDRVDEVLEFIKVD